MTKLRLRQIMLDAKIQPRVAISQDIINEYCQAHFDGRNDFPAVVIFQEGTKYYLADGWHRYHAALQAKMTEIDCEVKKGSLRDAILFSLSANAEHGLNRTNSDKRRAVMVCINDNEWQKMPARQIALTCGVSHAFVNLIYKEIAEEKVSGNVSTSKNKEKGKQTPAVSNTSQSSVKRSVFDEPVKTTDGVLVVPEGMQLVDKFSYEETMANYKDTLDENVALQKMIESDEPMKAAVAELKKVTSNLRILESRMHGLMSEKSEALKMVKAHKAVIDKLNKQIKRFGAMEEF